MAKRRNSFDPDALAKAGQEIAKRHQVRENLPVVEVEEEPIAKAPMQETTIVQEEETTPDVTEKPVKMVAKKKATAKNIVANTKSGDEKTQLCRIGLSYHRKLKFEAVKNDMTIRQFLENLIEQHIPDA